MASTSTDPEHQDPPGYDHVAADERTPLIQVAPIPENEAQVNGKSSNSDVEHNVEGEEEDVPLPKLQLLLLCYCRVVEPIAFFSIFPFVNQMIFETGNVRQQDVGFYSGLIVPNSFRLN